MSITRNRAGTSGGGFFSLGDNYRTDEIAKFRRRKVDRVLRAYHLRIRIARKVIYRTV